MRSGGPPRLRSSAMEGVPNQQPERDDDLAALEGLEAEFADLESELARVEQARGAPEPAEGPTEPPT